MKKNHCKNVQCEMIGILCIIICIVIAYVLRFCDSKFSLDSADWGAFGSYFGGMVSFISIILLFLTLREQQKENRQVRKENNRLKIESGYERLLSAVIQKGTTCKEIFTEVSDYLYKAQIEDEKKEIEMRFIDKDVYDKIVNYIHDKKNTPYVEDLYRTYCYLVRGIWKEKSLTMQRKKHYLQNLEYTLPIHTNFLILVTLIIMYENDKNNVEDNLKDKRETNDYKEIVRILKKIAMYQDVLIGNEYMDNIKDNMLCYDKSSNKSRISYLFMLLSNKNN